MVTVIHSKDFNVPRIFPASKNSKDFLLKGFPTFYSSENEYILPVNLWLNYLQHTSGQLQLATVLEFSQYNIVLIHWELGHRYTDVA
ncbi:hypothetical protein A1QS_13360 [Vibrio ordalii FS-238]|uniref:Uncharacterized protein n=1 Tax=Vibrio ordalii FS-238 TaxID=617133 RepID=A0A853R4E3_9VIBR|nr:hypothetical protein A1QS_13360 [Vibrio ordalii FS-238]